MGCIQSYFKRAHTAGLSPSSTQDSNSKTGGDDAGSCAQAANSTGTVEKDKLSADFTSTGDRAPEEPESNDTSYGVEATAVRTLAASTGTVAILGTTAKTPQSRRESRVSNLDNDEPVDKKEAVQTDSINVEIKDEHKNGGTNLVKKLDEVANTVEKIETVVNSSSVTTTVDKIESVINSSTKTESKVETKEEVVVVDVEKAYSEKVSTNEKAVEKPTVQTTTALVEDVKVDDDVAASPLEDGGFSENNFAEDEDDRPTTVLEIEKAQSSAEMRTSVSEASENEDTKGMDDEISSEQLKTNSLSDTTLSESYNAGLDSFKQPEDESATPIVENIGENEVSEGVVVVKSQKSPDQNGVLENDLQKEPELMKKEEVVKEVDILKKEISQIESRNLEADSKKEVDEEPIVKTVATKVESAPSNRNSGVDQALGNDLEGKVDLKVVENKVENGLSSVVVNGVPEVVDETSDDKMSAAATTIQATFRGYQTRQQNAAKSNETAETNGTNSNDKLVDEPVQPNILPNVEVVKVMQLTEIVDEGVEKKLESVIASKEGLIEKVDDKLDAAATAIQASFRGYQTRQNIKKDDNENKTEKSGEKDGESVESVVKGDDAGQKEKEIVIKSADVVEASSKVGDSVEKTISDGINHKDSDEKSKSDEIDHKAEGKSVVKTTSVEASQKDKETANKTEPDVPSKKVDELVEKSSSDVAATTIQANFRGYQARQNLQKKEEESEKKEVESKKVEEIVDNKVKESFDKTNTVEVSKKGETIVDNKEKESLDKTVAQNSKSVDAQVEKVPGSVEQTESVPPKNTQLETVKKSQESSEGSSFDSVQNVSLDPVTCVSIKDKSKVDKKDSTDNEVGGTGEELKENDNISLEETKEKLKDEEKESSAATTIQANFRGYQARQNLQKKEEESGKKGEEWVSGGEEGGEEDVKVSTAATKIQAGFRGYQTRKKLKEDEDDTVVIEALTSRTPKLEESVREEVDEICKRAVETTENLISQGLHKFHKSGSVEEKRVEGQENEGIVDKSEVVDVAKQTIEAVVEKAEKIADEKLNSAATTIQASFRGFQARQNLEKTTDIDGLPDFPPSTEDEDYTPVPDDDDLPLPDLEALESSYSEEVATEPLLPPPPASASGLPPSTTNLHNLIIPETEEVSEASTEVGTIEEDLKSLQRPQECDELDRLERDSSDGESSLSSAATKIQAGVRGYLTRKHINHGQTGTTSTSGPSLLSSDRSLGDFSSSREEDGPVRSMISTEEETEVGRHSGGSPPQVKRTGAAMKKRMSLDSRMAAGSSPAFSRTSRAMSVSAVREGAGNEEVWEMLQSELSCAATKIQSNFRGYQARKQLRRGDAVQMPTTSSSTTPGSNSLDGSVSRMGHVTEHTRSSGEYHDMIALTPPNIPNIGEEEEEEEEEKGKRKKTSQQQSDGSSSRDEDAMVKRRQGDESRPQKEEGEEAAAAARIQAGFRGYKVRRNMNAQDVATATNPPATSDGHKSPQQSTTTTTGSNNNHSSAEIEAATKIQAGFRGFKTRQELKSSKSGSAESK